MDSRDRPIFINPDMQAIGAKPIDPLKAKAWTTKEIPYMYVRSWAEKAKEMNVKYEDTLKWWQPEELNGIIEFDKAVAADEISLPPALADFFKGFQELKITSHKGWFNLVGIKGEGKNQVKKRISLSFDIDGELFESRIEENDRAENGDLASRSVIIQSPEEKFIEIEIKFGSENTAGLNVQEKETYHDLLRQSIDNSQAVIIDKCTIYHQTGNTSELIEASDGMQLKTEALEELGEPVSGKEWQVITRSSRIRPGFEYACDNSVSFMYTTSDENSPMNYLTDYRHIPVTRVNEKSDNLRGREVYESPRGNKDFKYPSSLALSCMPIDVELMKLSPIYPHNK